MCKTCVVDILVGTKLHNSAFLLSVVFCNGLSVAERRGMGGEWGDPGQLVSLYLTLEFPLCSPIGRQETVCKRNDVKLNCTQVQRTC